MRDRIAKKDKVTARQDALFEFLKKKKYTVKFLAQMVKMQPTRLWRCSVGFSELKIGEYFKLLDVAKKHGEFSLEQLDFFEGRTDELRLI